MTHDDRDTVDSPLSQARAFATAPLFALPDGSIIDLVTGYIPLLVNFTFEDKAAKGLRKLTDQAEPEPAVYFTALEMVRDHSAVMLTGETGSGKTTFARHLAVSLMQGTPSPRPVARNDLGAVQDEEWTLEGVLPLYLTVGPSSTFSSLIEAALPDGEHALSLDPAYAGHGILLILDGIEAAGDAGPQWLADALAFQSRHPDLKLLVLGEVSVVKSWPLPAGYVRYDLLPLLKSQRRETAARLAGLDLDATGVALGHAAANPAQFVMAMHGEDAGDSAEAITDRWLAKISGDAQTSELFCGLAFDALTAEVDDPTIMPITRVRQLLAAVHLASKPVDVAVAHFRKMPALWTPVITSIAARLSCTDAANALIEALIEGEGDQVLRGALLAADLVADTGPLRTAIAGHLLEIVSKGRLAAPEREVAGRILSRWGDPRTLDVLTDVAGGQFTFGSDTHVNSAPPHTVTVDAFRIGMYPVTNGAYGAFVRETGRLWRSPDGFAENRRNAPATDLTWHDTRAYCQWLTDRWQAEGRITADEYVRLPTEPEWERAARGDQPDMGANRIVYPWGQAWIDDAANSEESGFNTTSAVGLFPKGRSPYGCYDMVGQVWEWCTTLWGDDMATPDFRYPYSEDGREALDAAPSIRRVLRGGCFSSGKQKACCTYRGSLEPDGFWRGNGFRIVVSGRK
ncbi:SUMF1/EgtB/PvdO family nonheme iron enzyme [Agrobacterium rosae]|uniref:Serine/threonine-protein kinase pkn1 n=1 Tax=Agrobacterium rosae TaxID=1972867 RepID=A0A1R3TFK8_9HYPH|nr:SUMF1/EgtB/PvdO family nonheme iron enzyme [Agrobacterium rosae]SCX13993.1 Serine/threonine-protein kinase pkn1 [Agrobacterium rosae]